MKQYLITGYKFDGITIAFNETIANQGTLMAKAEESEIKLPTSIGSSEQQEKPLQGKGHTPERSPHLAAIRGSPRTVTETQCSQK